MATKYCPTCKKEVTPIKKMFTVQLCPECNKILASDYPPYNIEVPKEKVK